MDVLTISYPTNDRDPQAHASSAYHILETDEVSKLQSTHWHAHGVPLSCTLSNSPSTKSSTGI